jgi:integrase
MRNMQDRMKYLRKYSSAGTIRTYQSYTKLYLEFIYNSEISDLDAKADQYLSENRHYQADLEDWYASVKNYNPLTIRTKLNAIKIFLRKNGIKFDEEFWKDLCSNIKGARPRTMDRAPTKAELRKIVMNSPINGKALFLVLASSGARIGEALKIDVRDIDLTKDPAQITLRGEGTKTHNTRISFISSEATEWVKDWLKSRESYIKTSTEKGRMHIAKDTNVLFPFNATTAQVIWNNALEKVGLTEKDPSTRRFLVHIHSLRKFFSSSMNKAGVPNDIVEAIMGHEGYLRAAYRRYAIEELADFYKKGEHSVTVLSDTEELQKLRNEEEKTQTIIGGLYAKNLQLENRLASVEQLVGQLRVILEKTQA